MLSGLEALGRPCQAGQSGDGIALCGLMSVFFRAFSHTGLHARFNSALCIAVGCVTACPKMSVPHATQ